MARGAPPARRSYPHPHSPLDFRRPFSRNAVMRRWLLVLLAVGLLPRLRAAGQAVVYRIDVTGTVENGLAPYVARSLAARPRPRRGRGLSQHRHTRRPGGRRRADLRRGPGRHHSGLRLRQPARVQRRGPHRDLREGDLHAAGRRARRGHPGGRRRAPRRRRRWCRRCARSSVPSRSSAGSIPGSRRRWWTSEWRFPGSSARGSS